MAMLFLRTNTKHTDIPGQIITEDYKCPTCLKKHINEQDLNKHRAKKNTFKDDCGINKNAILKRMIRTCKNKLPTKNKYKNITYDINMENVYRYIIRIKKKK